MRSIIRSAVALAVLALAYAAWPLWGAYDFVRAVRHRDAEAITRRVNFPAVRLGLTAQVATTYLKLSGKDARMGQFGRAIAVAAVTSVADPIVARLVSAEALIALLQNGAPVMDPSGTPALPGAGTPFQDIGSGTWHALWWLAIHSEPGIRRFVLPLPVNAPAQRQFRLVFRLTTWTWKLTAINLPEELRLRLARELIRQIERK